MRQILISILLCCVASIAVSAQTTEFTFQGSIRDGATAANGNYDFEFALFDTLSGGAQVGATIPRNNILVTNGIFSVKLDFGSAFPGVARYLEIRVRLAGQPGITTLAPRQLVNSAPYSVKSLNADNAAQLGGVAANQYVVTTDPRLTDPRPPTAGSTNYVQNGTSLQATSNFNISGTGTANIISATTQFNIGGNRVLRASGNSLFVGVGAGTANTTGSDNSFFGRLAGDSNDTGRDNAFFGMYAGGFNTSGDFNAFFGRDAGISNTTGLRNTIVGALANVGSGDLTYATAIGAGAVASQSNSIFLGRSSGSDAVRIPGALSLSGNLVVASGNLVLIQSPVSLSTSGLGTSGGTALCRNGSTQIALCSSSLRYKTNINQFQRGLQLIDRLRPIAFDWKDGQPRDLGLGAEDVAAIEPLLVTYNSKGEVEGVKYDRIGVVLVNAVKEQQKIIEDQQTQINELRKLVCLSNRNAEICKEK